MSKLAVLILTKNEEENIVDVVENAKQVTDEVVIIDSGSTDETCSLAEKHGARVAFRAWDDDFSAQRNFALQQTDADWVLYLDADERISENLVKEIHGVTELNAERAYQFKRINIIFGQAMYHGGHRPDWVLRLFPRSAVRWSGQVHEHANVSCPIFSLKGRLHHFTYSSWEQYLNKLNLYTSLAVDKFESTGKKYSFIHVVLHPVWGFFQDYILKAGFLDGKMGFVMSVQRGVYLFEKYLKAYSRRK